MHELDQTRMGLSPETEQKLSDSLQAITDLILAVLTSNTRDRFARAERLCRTAATIQQEGSKKISDFESYDPHTTIALPPGQLQLPVYAGGGDQASMLREIMMMIQPMMGGQKEAHQANRMAHMASELSHLSDALRTHKEEGLPTGAIKRRIKHLRSQLGSTNGKSDLVPADVLRGHSTGIDGQQQNQGNILPSDADRSGGNGVAAQAIGIAGHASTVVDRG